jgi:lipopolysaccharide biosynthesis glycosyltransferase
MNVLFAINEAFIPGFLTAVFSLCANNPGFHDIYLMHDGISERKQLEISKSFRKLDCKIHFVNLGAGAFSSSVYSSLPRYYSQSINRLLPQQAVPNSVHRLLYLDADVVVNGNLQDFYNTDFSGNFLVAPSIRRDGQDGGPYWDSETMVYQSIKIPLKPETLYFNSGVLLMNLDKFRTIGEDFYRPIVENHKEQIVFADQDILNLAFEGKALRVVDRRLNCTVAENVRKRKGEYRWVKNNVLVLHFVVNPKPWHAFKYRPAYFKIYMSYYRLENKVFSYLFRYSAWISAKPVHFITHVFRKLFRA